MQRALSAGLIARAQASLELMHQNFLSFPGRFGQIRFKLERLRQIGTALGGLCVCAALSSKANEVHGASQECALLMDLHFLCVKMHLQFLKD